MKPLATTCLLAIIASSALIGSCRRPTSGPAPAVRPLVVIASGDTQGWIVPCGCVSNQSGGLPRRATYVEDVRRGADVVLVDTGGAPAGASAYDRTRFEAIARGEVAMQIAAHNIGRAEAALGPDYLRGTAQQLSLPLVSANVRDESGRLVAESFRCVSAGGRGLVLIGVLDECFASDDVVISDPRRAVLAALREAQGSYDTVVVLAYMPEDAIRQLAAALPEADLVIGGPTGQPLPPERVGPALIASATNKGKFLARFDASASPSGEWSGSVVELTDEFEDEPGQRANLAVFHEELARRDFTPDETSLAEPSLSGGSDYRLAGRQRCRECHESECDVWDESAHAAAWASLEETGSHVDPECQRCHTTGYGQEGGFSSRATTPAAVNVGCESCHGPSSAHAADSDAKTAYQAAAADHCVECHDRENSPQFDYDEYWEQIRHELSSKVAGTLRRAVRLGRVSGFLRVTARERGVADGTTERACYFNGLSSTASRLDSEKAL